MSALVLGVRLGTRLRKRREALGWSQAELAEAAGVTPNYVGVVERGEKLPTLETLDAFAQALSVEVGALVAEEEPNAWADETTSLVRAVPPTHRRLALALLRALVAEARRERPPYPARATEPRAVSEPQRRRKGRPKARR